MRRTLDARFKNFRNDARQHAATLRGFAFVAGGCQPGCSGSGRCESCARSAFSARNAGNAGCASEGSTLGLARDGHPDDR